MADFLVVGASVAGSATAINLARMGHSVQLVDKAFFPRRKACGEGLFSQGVAELERLGLLEELLPHSRQLTALRFTVAGETIEAPLGGKGRAVIGVERRLLDAELLQMAVDSGVEVNLGLRVEGLTVTGGRFTGVKTDRGELSARVIIAADGARSRLRRVADLDRKRKPRRYGVSAHFSHNGWLPRIDVHFKQGYEVYVTPVGDGLINVSLLMAGSVAKRFAGRLRATYCQLVADSQALSPEAQLVEEPIVAGPFPVVAKQTYRSNLLLVGDAAGFYDGITGEGISLALVSARLCANAATAFLAGDAQAMRSYDHSHRGLMRNSRIIGSMLLTLADHPSLARRAAANLARHPATFSTLLAINQGEQGFRSLRPRDAVALLLGL